MKEIFDQFSEDFMKNTVVVFTKVDSPKSSILNTLQLLKQQPFFDGLLSVVETSAKDD